MIHEVDTPTVAPLDVENFYSDSPYSDTLLKSLICMYIELTNNIFCSKPHYTFIFKCKIKYYICHDLNMVFIL